MACLSKLDRQLKDLEEKLKYILIIRKIKVYFNYTKNVVSWEIKSQERHGSGKYIRMSAERFQHLLSLIRDKITKKTTRFRKRYQRKRLVITLRFLATWESQQSLTYAFRVGKATLSKVIAETCDAIYLNLDDHIQCPSNAEEWRNIASQFEDRWNFPHAIGAIDGKHIRILCPKKLVVCTIITRGRVSSFIAAIFK